MKRLFTPRKALALVVMGLGANAGALTTGPLQGATAVGRPLDLSAQVQFDSRDADEKCLRADVFYGDAAVPPDQVAVSVHRSEMLPTSLVRIVSAKAVDEPVVTVVLRAGCRDSMTRRYVVLADAPAEGPVAVAASSVLGAAPALRSSADLRPVAAVVPAALVARTAGAPVTSSARSARATRAVAAAKPAPKVRLEMAPVAAIEPRWLRVSTEMNAPTGDATRRAAAALLWQAINAQPQDVLRVGDRIRGLEKEIATLRELSMKHRYELDALRDSQGPSLGDGWTLAGVLLLLAALTGGTFAWRNARQRATGPVEHWYEPHARDAKFDEIDSRFAPAPVPAPPAQELDSVDFDFTAEPDVELPLQGGAGAVSTDAAASHEAPRPPARARTTTPGVRLMLLADVLHEAEFLVSLGDIERAVDVLRGYVERTRNTSALAILELRELCRACGDDEGLDFAEEEFRLRFGEEPPRSTSGRGLEGCETALARIMSEWPRPPVLKLIEDLLFSPPSALGGFPGLDAWRDLLWLHGLAERRMPGAQEAAAPLAGDGTEMTLERLHALDFEAAPNRFAVDLSLANVDMSRHRVRETVHASALPPVLQDVVAPDLVPLPAIPTPPPAPPTDYEDFFDAVGAAEGRALHIR